MVGVVNWPFMRGHSLLRRFEWDHNILLYQNGVESYRMKKKKGEGEEKERVPTVEPSKRAKLFYFRI